MRRCLEARDENLRRDSDGTLDKPGYDDRTSGLVSRHVAWSAYIPA